MKRKYQNKYYRARVVTLTYMLIKSFRPINTSQIYVNNQSMCSINYCLINSVINTLTRVLRWNFILRAFYIARRTQSFPFFIERGIELFSVKRNFFIRGNICESNKRNIILQQSFSRI